MSDEHGELAQALTVRDAWQSYKAAGAPGISPAAAEARTFHMRMHVLPALAAERIEDLDGPRLKRLIDDMLAAGTHPMSAMTALGVLHSVVQRLVDEQVLQANPVAIQRDWVTVPDVRPKSLTRQQLKEFLTAAMTEPCFPVVLFLAWTGCRLGEALALRWSEVDFARPAQARIVRTLRHGKEVSPEPRFGRRAVPLPVLLVENMMALRSRLEGPDGLVYKQANESGVDSRNLQHVFRRVSERAGLPPVRPSTLRRTWGAMMLDQGMSSDSVSRTLGDDPRKAERSSPR